MGASMIFPDLRVEFIGGNKIQPVDFRPETENTAGAPGLDHETEDLGWWEVAEIEPSNAMTESFGSVSSCSGGR